jgi:hypothetical protein
MPDTSGRQRSHIWRFSRCISAFPEQTNIKSFCRVLGAILLSSGRESPQCFGRERSSTWMWEESVEEEQKISEVVSSVYAQDPGKSEHGVLGEENGEVREDVGEEHGNRESMSEEDDW